ncbi:hypothetical protein A6C57_25720 [Fibrella sp. ES10-3-2-2]
MQPDLLLPGALVGEVGDLDAARDQAVAGTLLFQVVIHRRD